MEENINNFYYFIKLHEVEKKVFYVYLSALQEPLYKRNTKIGYIKNKLPVPVFT